jgi:hypothetical protein
MFNSHLFVSHYLINYTFVTEKSQAKHISCFRSIHLIKELFSINTLYEKYLIDF